MKKLLFGLISLSLFFINSGFTSMSSKPVYTCHIVVFWHNSSGYYRTDIYQNIGPNGTFEDCKAIAAGMM
jgi:hypothetical protein